MIHFSFLFFFSAVLFVTSALHFSSVTFDVFSFGNQKKKKKTPITITLHFCGKKGPCYKCEISVSVVSQHISAK